MNNVFRNGISIAMATYNGCKYIKEQLETIAAQTLTPDELVVGWGGLPDEVESSTGLPKPQSGDGGKNLENWIRWVRRKGEAFNGLLQPMGRVAKTLEKHREGILVVPRQKQWNDR